MIIVPRTSGYSWPTIAQRKRKLHSLLYCFLADFGFNIVVIIGEQVIELLLVRDKEGAERFRPI